ASLDDCSSGMMEHLSWRGDGYSNRRSPDSRRPQGLYRCGRFHCDRAAGGLFEETERTLFCSDLFHQVGDLDPLTSADVVGRSHQALKEYQAGILAEYVPYTPLTAHNLKKLAELNPKTLAMTHS